MTKTQKLSLIALRDMVVFPGTIAPIFVGRTKSLQALLSTQITENNSRYILLVSQKQKDQESPSPNDLYSIGVLAKIIQIVKLQNSNAKILVEALDRVKIYNISGDEAFEADYTIIKDQEVVDLDNMTMLTSSVVQLFNQYTKSNKKVNPEIIEAITTELNRTPMNCSYIANILASHLISPLSIKQNLLEETNPLERIKVIMDSLISSMAQIETEQVLQQRVKKQIEKTQRDYYLHEQMKAIQKELDDDKSDFSDIEKKIKTLKLSKEAKEKAESELKKLKFMNQMSAESSVTRNYLDTFKWVCFL